MFVRNHTDREVVCRRGDLDLPERGIAMRFANLLSYDSYRHVGSSLELEPAARCPATLRRVLDAPGWDGTSVTATGTVAPPAGRQLMRQVTLRVGDVSRTLVARGPRHWVRQASDWVPSLPAAWQPLTLCWTAAFGGSVELPAGKDEQSGLPRPAFNASHPQNPVGTGFTPHQEPEGAPPRLELLDEQLTRLGELPIPGCFAPLEPRLAGMTIRPHERHPLHATSYRSLLGPIHVAPGYLVLPWQPAGTPIELIGLEQPLSFNIPAATLRVRAKQPGSRTGVRLRAIHLDADERQVNCIWQHAFVTDRRSLPDLEVHLEEASS